MGLEFSWVFLPAAALFIGLLNLFTWPRPHFRRNDDLPVSVLIPARNEARNIEAAVTAALDTGAAEVVVADDDSTDATPDILRRLQEKHPRLRVVTAGPLPKGWVGKPHACHRLAQQARQPWLLYVDADVQLRPAARAGFGELVRRFDADVVTAFPHQIMRTWAERWVVPLLHLTYVSWLPLLLIPRLRWTQILAANGQMLLVSRKAYDDLGGFAAVRSEVVDDMAFCRRAKSMGRRVLFAEGSRIGACRMYHSTREVWEGFSKNLFLGLGGRLHRLILALALYLATFLVPPLVWWSTPTALDAAMGTGAIVVLRLAVAIRFRHGLDTVLVHPLSMLAFVAIGINSALWGLTRRVAWRGRVYPGTGDAPPPREGLERIEPSTMEGRS
jgi:cellulose synthase/poly-beta-1,6-N-acetylglucosamine synthase-like glycosyltransferase